MAVIMTKRGNKDNIVTYEHICDRHEDINLIQKKYVTLGSVCIVVEDTEGGLGVYIANSHKEWRPLVANGNGSTNISTALQLYVCDETEYDPVSFIPTVADKNNHTLYLVPFPSGDNDQYKEFIYVNNSWEKIGGSTSGSDGIAESTLLKLNAAYNHALAKGNEYAEGIYKIATNTEGHVISATQVTKQDFQDLGIIPEVTTLQFKLYLGDLVFDGSQDIIVPVYDGSTIND